MHIGIDKIDSVYKISDAGFVQRREWMLHKIRPDKYPFNVATNFEMNSFDPLLMQRILNLLVDRHEILRTTLEVRNGILRQIIQPNNKFVVDYEYFDPQDLSFDQRIRFASDIIAKCMGSPFDFENGPMFRVLVFKITQTQFSVYFVFHHMISDEHSFQILVNDLRLLYKFESQKHSYSLPAVTQYSHYAIFENDLLETSSGNKYKEYWRKMLANGIPDLALIHKGKLDQYNFEYQKRIEEVEERVSGLQVSDKRFLPTVIRRYKVEDAGEIVYVYNKKVFEEIKIYQQSSQNGLLSILIASLLLAFYKITNQTYFAFEVPALRRPLIKFNHTLGWLTSQGPCFFNIPTDNKPVQYLLKYIDDQLYFLSKNCIFPFETVDSKTRIPIGSRMPVFLTLSYADIINPEQETGVVFSRFSGSGTYQDFAFTFILYKNQFRLNIIYNSALLDFKDVELLLCEHVCSLQNLLKEFHT